MFLVFFTDSGWITFFEYISAAVWASVHRLAAAAAETSVRWCTGLLIKNLRAHIKYLLNRAIYPFFFFQRDLKSFCESSWFSPTSHLVRLVYPHVKVVSSYGPTSEFDGKWFWSLVELLGNITVDKFLTCLLLADRIDVCGPLCVRENYV